MTDWGEGRRKEFHGEGTGDSRVCGDGAFLEKVVGRREGSQGYLWMWCWRVVCRHFRIAPAELALPGKNRALAHARAMAARLVQDVPALSLMELSRRTGRDISFLSADAARLRAKATSLHRQCSKKKRSCWRKYPNAKPDLTVFIYSDLNPSAPLHRGGALAERAAPSPLRASTPGSSGTIKLRPISRSTACSHFTPP